MKYLGHIKHEGIWKREYETKSLKTINWFQERFGAIIYSNLERSIFTVII